MIQLTLFFDYLSESAACLQLVVETFDKYHVILRRLCCNNDSSIRADCQWSNADYLKNNNTDVLCQIPKRVGKFKSKLQPQPAKGKLLAHVPDPIFVANPNHQHKILTGVLIKLDKQKVHVKHTMNHMDSTRMGNLIMHKIATKCCCYYSVMHYGAVLSCHSLYITTLLFSNKISLVVDSSPPQS